MRWITTLAALALLLLPVTLGSQGCGDKLTACQEECDSDDECAHGHKCLRVTIPEVRDICLPEQCEECFGQGLRNTCTVQNQGGGRCTYMQCENVSG